MNEQLILNLTPVFQFEDTSKLLNVKKDLLVKNIWFIRIFIHLSFSILRALRDFVVKKL